MEQRYLTSKQAAEYLGFSENTLSNARNTGLLSGHKAPRFYRMGERTVRYDINDLDDWMAEGLMEVIK